MPTTSQITRRIEAAIAQTRQAVDQNLGQWEQETLNHYTGSNGNNNSFRIFARNTSGVSYEIYVRPYDTISTVKSKINEVTGYSLQDKSLVFGGCTLENDRFVRDSSIQENFTVSITLRLCGEWKKICSRRKWIFVWNNFVGLKDMKL